ncbi:glycosyltransferase family 2 protein [Shimia sp. MIT1388]|uniref:glycosyltransferase family 2 protein n=1 Tax=Shimia sp. MIT1388 TaxID=3096992 RepID=UPI00399B9F5B
MSTSPTWGVVATIKAPAVDILNFVAHHLELGAAHVWIYLDAANPEAKIQLKPHPQLTVVRTGDNYWQKTRGKKPPMHQPRQSFNVRHAYNRAKKVDWLLHIDVDEFLWPDRSIDAQLAALPQDCLVARVRPAEAMASVDDSDLIHFKSFISDKAKRDQIVAEIYPDFAAYLKNGFVSHVAGKMFLRTGQKDMTIKIHNVAQNGRHNPGQVELTDVTLLHLHTTSWAHWMQSFAYRHKKGSYRDELGSAVPEDQGGLNLHKLFAHLAEEPDGLRQFYEEVCVATPELRQKLEAHGLLRSHRLDLDTKRRKHFPGFVV